MQNHQLINQSSGKVEFWTPQPIIEAARLTMGKIQLDPASTFEANMRVRADFFFDEKHNGLIRNWGTLASPNTVWLNMPFRRETNAQWINKLFDEYDHARISEACCITFASTSEAWFKPLLYWPQCFLVPRTNYLLPNGTVMRGVTKGSVVTYLGQRPLRFRADFKSLGVVKVRI